MPAEDAKARMRALVDQISEASYAYYVLDNPIISDMQWDQLYDELKKLEAETGVIFPDSPTRKVGGETLKGFETHRHLARLWSMDKVQNFEALDDWIARTEKLVGKSGLQYYVEYKFDGLTLNLTYHHGKLVQVATRGNGITGEAILKQAMTIHSIPKDIPYQGLMEIQGECIMRLSTLEKYNKTASVPLKNARNAAAGGLRNLDPAVTASRHLDAFFYQIGYIEGTRFRTQKEMLDFIRDQGFQVSPYLGEAFGMDEMEARICEVESQRADLDWLIDGAVIKIADYDIREKLGYTDKFPKWAVAYKFKAEECVTRLKDISWEVGRTGKLTPIGYLDDVNFYGVTVRKATLNNMNDIRRKGIAIGCNVWIRRSNDVIPEIIGRSEGRNPDEQEILEPDICPACGSKLVKRGAHLFCMNRESCKPQAVARIAHFAERDAMDIDGLSEKTAGMMYDKCHVRIPSDLYHLTETDIRSLEGFKDRKALKLIREIDKSKDCELDAFLFAIGIPNVGVKTARDLARHFRTLDRLQEATMGELISIPDIGETVAQSIMDFLSFAENRYMIQRLLGAGVTPKAVNGYSEGPFKGKSIVVTGRLETLGRKEAEDLIHANGGIAAGSVSSKTAFVVAGEDAGSKLEKAKMLGIEIIDEEEFLRRCERRKKWEDLKTTARTSRATFRTA